MEMNNIIAGPCSAESEEQVLKTAEQLSKIGIKSFRAGVWKPRTKPGGFEGIGELALNWLKKVKDTYGMNIAIEVANKEQVELALKYGINILWIGARTTADPFAVQEIADAIEKYPYKNIIKVLIKNPICPDLDLWEGAYLRIKNTGITNIGVIHRGFKVYEESKYRNEPIWRIPLDFKIKYPEVMIYCDPSHISGNRQYIEEISNMAINIYGFDGLMIESHYNPEIAWTDAKQQVTPQSLLEIINNINSNPITILENPEESEILSKYRAKIDYYDEHLIYSLEERLKISKLIGKYKKDHNLITFQANRWKSLLENVIKMGKEHGLDENYIKDIWQIIHEKSIEVQK